MVVGCLLVLGIGVAIDGAGGGVDHPAGLAGPLQSSVEAAAGRVGLSRQLQHGVRRIVGQIEEEWRLLRRSSPLGDVPLGGGCP